MDNPDLGSAPSRDHDEAAGEQSPRPRIGPLAYDDPGRDARWAAWRIENGEAIATYNRWFEEEGHPLIGYKLF